MTEIHWYRDEAFGIETGDRDSLDKAKGPQCTHYRSLDQRVESEHDLGGVSVLTTRVDGVARISQQDHETLALRDAFLKAADACQKARWKIVNEAERVAAEAALTDEERAEREAELVEMLNVKVPAGYVALYRDWKSHPDRRVDPELDAEAMNIVEFWGPIIRAQGLDK